jgi:hypothetical protein
VQGYSWGQGGYPSSKISFFSSSFSPPLLLSPPPPLSLSAPRSVVPVHVRFLRCRSPTPALSVRTHSTCSHRLTVTRCADRLNRGSLILSRLASCLLHACLRRRPLFPCAWSLTRCRLSPRAACGPMLLVLKVADYIPALADVPAHKFAVAITTRSGQRFSLGDSKDFFCLQSVSKVLTYCEALKQHGTEKTHNHVGREPSGESFNAMTLKPVHQPDCPERQVREYITVQQGHVRVLPHTLSHHHHLIAHAHTRTCMRLCTSLNLATSLRSFCIAHLFRLTIPPPPPPPLLPPPPPSPP